MHVVAFTSAWVNSVVRLPVAVPGLLLTPQKKMKLSSSALVTFWLMSPSTSVPLMLTPSSAAWLAPTSGITAIDRDTAVPLNVNEHVLPDPAAGKSAASISNNVART